MSNLTNSVYQKIRKQHKDPVKVLHAIYNLTCNPKDKVESINAFQGLLTTWLARNNKTLIAGSLTILKKFDSEFAQ
jgi:hypothetical protein